MLVLSRKLGQSFIIGSNIEIIVTEVSRDSVKISIDAPREIPIIRKELIEATNANFQACALVESSALIELKNNIKNKTDK